MSETPPIPTSDITWADAGRRAEVSDGAVAAGWTPSVKPAVEIINRLRREQERHAAWAESRVVRTFDDIDEAYTAAGDTTRAILEGDKAGTTFSLVGALGVADLPGDVNSDGAFKYSLSAGQITILDVDTDAVLYSVADSDFQPPFAWSGGAEPVVFFNDFDDVGKWSPSTGKVLGFATPATIGIGKTIKFMDASAEIIAVALQGGTSGGGGGHATALDRYNVNTGAFLDRLTGPDRRTTRAADIIPVIASRDQAIMVLTWNDLSNPHIDWFQLPSGWDSTAGTVTDTPLPAGDNFAVTHDADHFYVITEDRMSVISKLTGGIVWRFDLVVSPSIQDNITLFHDGRYLRTNYQLESVSTSGDYAYDTRQRLTLFGRRIGTLGPNTPMMVKKITPITRG